MRCTYKLDYGLLFPDSFVRQLHVMLQLDDTGKQQSIINLSSDELGIDSLNAVEIRSWFLKELSIDMPVLLVLGGATVGDLVAHALDKLPEDLKSGSGTQVEPQSSKPATNPTSIAKRQIVGTDTQKSNSGSSVESINSETNGNIQVVHPYTDNGSSASEIQNSSFSIISMPESASSQTYSQEPKSTEPALLTNSKASEILRTAPMSFGQSRFWFLRSYLEDQSTFNITCSISLRGDLRIDDLENAVRVIGQRHEALRTCFFVDENRKTMQGVLSESPLHLEQKRFTNQHDVKKEIAKLTEHIYDLDRGRTMRIVLLTPTSSKSQLGYQLLIGYHHINMDGISLQVILAELEKAYTHVLMSPRVRQYPDFALKQHEEYNTGKWKDDLAFWRKQFLDFPPVFPLLSLSDVQSRPALTRYEHHRADFRIDTTLGANILETCRKYKVTPYHFHLATFKALLLRLSDVQDLCIGVADGNRIDSDTQESVGFFLNLLPLRFALNSQQIFLESLKEARTKSYSAMAHSRVPFDVLLNELEAPRSATHSPVFQVFVDYRQGIQERRQFGDCQLEGQYYEAGRTSYDIVLDVTDNKEGNSLLTIAVQKCLYSLDAANTLMKCYVNLLKAFSNDPSKKLDQPAIFNLEDVQKAIELGRGML
jgi:hybrid polyketide synthase / nonribosomal peptide synthetase ACE1